MNHNELLLENFKAISRIPRPSGHMDEISEFILNDALSRGLQARKDETYNVVVFVPATEGYEEHETVMIQGHMDLVAEKAEDSPHNFQKDPIELIFEGDILHANQTTLGGDDGIAVASMMALMEDRTIKHPALELVFTADEETGMFGAEGLDTSDLKAKKMINLDNESEGEFTVSCAGGVRLQAALPIAREEFSGTRYLFRIDTEKGGHSGVEIHKNRPNAVLCLMKALSYVSSEAGEAFRLIRVFGGKMDNAIPMNAQAEVVLSKEADLSKIQSILETPYLALDDHPHFTYEKLEEGTFTVWKNEVLQSLLKATLNVPNGVINYSEDIKGLVESSMNLGVIKEKDDTALVRISVRSSVEEKKHEILSGLIALFRENGFGAVESSGDYPGWAYRKESPLRETMVKIYADKYTSLSGRKPVVLAIHAGLECGLILKKMPDLDIVSCGADAYLIHTPKEYVRLSSVYRMFDFLKDVLEAL